MVPTSHPQLETILQQIGDATLHAQRFLGRPAEAFQRRPSPESWSAAECLRHLSLTTSAYLPMIDAALAVPDTRNVAPSHRYRRDLFGALLTWLLEPPFRSKSKTTAQFVPLSAGDPASVVGEFEALQREFALRVERCTGRDLERKRLASPFNARVKYNLYSALTIMMAHERRHLWQADRAMAAASGGIS